MSHPNGTALERLDGYHALRHSFISVLAAQGKTWDQIAAFVGHLDPKTTRRYIHFMPRTEGRRWSRYRLSSEQAAPFNKGLKPGRVKRYGLLRGQASNSALEPAVTPSASSREGSAVASSRSSACRAYGGCHPQSAGKLDRGQT